MNSPRSMYPKPLAPLEGGKGFWRPGHIADNIIARRRSFHGGPLGHSSCQHTAFEVAPDSQVTCQTRLEERQEWLSAAIDASGLSRSCRWLIQSGLSGSADQATCIRKFRGHVESAPEKN